MWKIEVAVETPPGLLKDTIWYMDVESKKQEATWLDILFKDLFHFSLSLSVCMSLCVCMYVCVHMHMRKPPRVEKST